MTSKDKEPFYQSIVEALKPTTANQDLNRTLYNFQNQISAIIFTRYHINDVPEIFRSIWKLLLSSAGNSSSTTRLASYRATGAFLTRVTPYYPDIIHDSFSNVTLLATIDVKSSAIIASSFAFISRYIAPPFMKKFINQTPVFHHFSSNDPVFSEHLPTIISNLGHLGKDWLKNLLQFFLEKIDESASASRYLIKAVTAIISHNPVFFINHIIEWIQTSSQNSKSKQNPNPNEYEIDKKYISLFTFFISGHQEEIQDCLDLYLFAKSAALVLNESKNNLTDIDSAFQMLSTPSNSFRVRCEDAESNSIKITVIKTVKNSIDSKVEYIDHDSEKVEIVINIENLEKRPSFNMINLPLERLKPTSEDSHLVLGAKFKSISQYYTGQNSHLTGNEDRTLEVFDIYEPYLKSDYNEVRSAALQGLAICIERFIEEVPSEKLYLPLKRVLFTKTVSWFHSFDILRIIKNITNYRLLVEKLGIDFFVSLLKQLIGFCFCDHDSLSNESTLALADITSMNNLSIIVQTIIEKTDFFDSSILKHSVATMSLIIEKINKIVCKENGIEYEEQFVFENGKNNMHDEVYKEVPGIEFYSTQLIEAAPFYFDNLYLLSEILRYFSIYKTKNLDKFGPLLNSAIFIIISTVEVISGQIVVLPENLSQFISSSFITEKKEIIIPAHANSPLSPNNSIEITKTNTTTNANSDYKDMYEFFKSFVQQDIMHKNIDIITESFSSNDYKSFILPMKYSLLCCFLYLPPNDSVFLANISHQLFPTICSKYYQVKWMYLEENQHNKILTSIPKFLRYVNDLRVHAEWCKICMKKIDVATTDDHYLMIVDLLIEIALDYFQSTFGTDPYLASIFCKFLYGIHYGNAKSVIQKYFDAITPNLRDKKFFIKIYEIYPESMNLWPETFKGINEVSNNEIKNEEINKITFEDLDSISKEIEFEGEKIGNIYLIKNEQIQPLFEEIVKHDKIKLLKQIIEVAEKRKVKLDSKLDDEQKRIEYSKESMEIVIKYISRNKVILSFETFKYLVEQYTTQARRGNNGSSFCSGNECNDEDNENKDKDEIYLRYALINLNGIFEPYCALVIENDPMKLLDSLLKSNKIKKKELISLLSLVHKDNIQFDLQTLYKLSVKLFLLSDNKEQEMKQTSISRYRVLFLFLSVIIQQIHFYFRKTNFLNPSSIVTLEFTHQLINKITPDFERLPVEILSYLFLILVQTIPVDNECVLFIWRLFSLCSSSTNINATSTIPGGSLNNYNNNLIGSNIIDKSSPYGHLHQIFIGLSCNSRFIGKNYIFGLADVILPCLQSKMPSKFMTGLRLVEQFCLSVPPSTPNYFLQKAIELIMHRISQFLFYLPPCPEQIYRTLMSFLMRGSSYAEKKFFFNYLPDFAFVSPHSGGFIPSIAFYPAAIQLINPSNCDNFSKIYHYACETLFKFPLGFSYGLKTLLQYARKLTEDECESVVVDEFVNWLKLVKDSKSRPSSYEEFNPESESIRLYKAHSDPNQVEMIKESKQKIAVSNSSNSLATLQKKDKDKEPKIRKSSSKGFSILSRWAKRKEEKKEAKKESKKESNKDKEEKKIEKESSKENSEDDEHKKYDESDENIDSSSSLCISLDGEADVDQFSEHVISQSDSVETSIIAETSNSSGNSVADSSASINVDKEVNIEQQQHHQPQTPQKAQKTNRKRHSPENLTSYHLFYFGYTFCPNYKLSKQVGEWIDACLLFMTPSKAFSILVFNLIRYVKFGVIYPKILKLFIEYRDDEELNEMVDGIVDLPHCKCHKIALRLFKTCDKFDKMIELASFDEDCEASDKLVEEMMCYLHS